ncbi:ribosome-associated translation inhibitor RaiA [Salinifilum aidingensis]
MDIVVKGRNVEVPEHYREQVAEKLSRLERYTRKAIRTEVELFHERNPRQAKNCQRVELTLVGKGGPVRAEAAAGNFYAALDAAAGKLENRLRRMHDRRKVHYGQRNPTSVAEATSAMAHRRVVTERTPGAPSPDGSTVLLETPEHAAENNPEAVLTEEAGTKPEERAAEPELLSENTPEVAAEVPEQRMEAGNGYSAGGYAATQEYEPGRIVREKEHPAKPMTVDEALYQMELVGHDFYLFSDADSGKPSVVYRRKGFDYGVIRLAESA